MKKRFEMKLVALLLVAAALLGCLTTSFTRRITRWRRTAGIPLWRK